MEAKAETTFFRPWWLCNTHLETIWARKAKVRPAYKREIANTFDNDPIAIDYLAGDPTKPFLVIFHGLEGCSNSHTVRILASWFNNLGWNITIPHFRSCGIMNNLPRAYHAGDVTDIEWMAKYVKSSVSNNNDLYAIGISLGGNALAKWLGENAGQKLVKAAATVCAPVDLQACSVKLGQFFNRHTYGNFFLKSLKNKVDQKRKHYPFLISAKNLNSIKTIRQFDDLYTAPVHGFAGVDDYYQKASSQQSLDAVNTPLLMIHSANDALVPVPKLPINQNLVHIKTEKGGHSGFVSAPYPGKFEWLPSQTYAFFQDIK